MSRRKRKNVSFKTVLREKRKNQRKPSERSGEEEPGPRIVSTDPKKRRGEENTRNPRERT